MQALQNRVIQSHKSNADTMSRMSLVSPKSSSKVHSFSSFVKEYEVNQAFEKVENFDFDIFEFES